jgi:ubiquinone/menaquinone biosynthesis C-methylase UbiE
MKGYSQDLAERYSSLRDNYTATDARAFNILRNIGIEMKDVLDFGCGDGKYSFRLAENGARSVKGIDNSAAMIGIANNKLKEMKLVNVEFIECDGADLPLPSKSVDIAFANFVLHHFQNTNRPLREIARTLREQGYLLATFNTALLKDHSLLNTEIPLRLGTFEIFVTVHNLLKADEEILSALDTADLEILLYEEIPNPSLAVDPNYANAKNVERIKTMICLARKR